jgi:acetolactate synthase-1/2/3 large subunit
MSPRPGGTNAITGVYGAYVDLIPMLVISGQVKRETTVRSTDLPLRQLGDQNSTSRIWSVRSPYAAMVTDPRAIRYHLEKALHLATNGRPGPVWLDIPLDVQAARIDPTDLPGFDPIELDEPWRKPISTRRPGLSSTASRWPSGPSSWSDRACA